jgi:acid stress-induced BolA-like protein IbaG/YrbA
MASQPYVDPELDQLKQSLRGLFKRPDESRIDVFHSSGPNFRAIVVSDEFKGQAATTRQTRIWDYLRESSLDADLVNRLFAVHPYTWEEFREQFQET